MNYEAPILSDDAEVRCIAEDGAAITHVLLALRVMLRFYGMHIQYSKRSVSPNERQMTISAVLSTSGDIAERSRQYTNLLQHGHNYLRICRILQFLGEVQLEPIKVAWLKLLAVEVFTTQVSPSPLYRCRDSFLHYWLQTVVCSRDREEVMQVMLDAVKGKMAPYESRMECQVQVPADVSLGLFHID
ncbi:Opioid growth factor receptor (OGFr) conserved region containing protein, putative [Angomonas deanei]|uniref:Opioid growth factor receptor (OGFr) conserved region containing protein, putative n=1 Tax=Angomonas deanei TaxID=59799 RepID=A0A7G2C7G4_9TRYP|nr:Opioid growth factor receptor (OGFr) conserved region containing protein, putative [Angomonas deanei]